MQRLNVTVVCPNCDEEQKIEVSYWPERSAPMCSNPDSPAYSDSGDPGDVEADVSCKCGFDFNDESFREKLYDLAVEEDIARYEDAMESRAEDMMDRRRGGW